MPDMTSIQRQVLALCSLTSAGDRCDWGVLARQAHRERSLDALLAGDVVETSARAHTTGWVIATAAPDDSTAAWARADSEYRAAVAAGARLTTVLDDDFPLNLRLIHNLPPFLFKGATSTPTSTPAASPWSAPGRPLLRESGRRAE